MVQLSEVVPVFTGTVFISAMGVNQKGSSSVLGPFCTVIRVQRERWAL